MNLEIRLKFISCLIQFKSERLTETLQTVRCHIYDCINTIYQFIKPFLDNKMSIFEEYGAFKSFIKYSKAVPSLHENILHCI